MGTAASDRRAPPDGADALQMESLIQCAYASTSRRAFDDLEMAALLHKSRQNNQSLAITGILVFADRSFLQVIEGEAGKVDALLARIAADPRHHKLTRILREPIRARTFGNWSMGYSRILREDAVSIDAADDFLAGAPRLEQLEGAQVKRLLRSLAIGRRSERHL
jgi:hypothetical protein